MTEYEKKVVEIYKVYEKRLLISNSVDFDDLLIMPIKLFRTNPDILNKYQERFKKDNPHIFEKKDEKK